MLLLHLKVSDEFGVGTTSSVEPKTHFYHFVLQITINGFWTSDHFHAALLFRKVFGKKTCIGVAVITANHNETVQLELFAIFERSFKLGRGLDFVSTGTDHIEATAIAERVDIRFFKLSEIIFIDTFGSIKKAVKDGLRVNRGDIVVKTDDYIVTTRGLATT